MNVLAGVVAVRGGRARHRWLVALFLVFLMAACGPSRADRLEALVADGEAHLTADRLDEAAEAFSAALELDGGSARALIGAARTDELLASREAFERGLAALEQEEFLAARDAFAAVRSDDTVRHAAAQAALRDAEDAFVTAALDLAEDLLDEGDVSGALDVMARLAVLFPEHPELRARGPGIADRAAELVMETATYQLLEGTVAEARALLQRGLEVLRSSDAYASGRTRLQELAAAAAARYGDDARALLEALLAGAG